MTGRRTPRLAANPIPWWSRGGRVDKSPAVLDEAYGELAAIGFRAVKADVPEGMSAAAYRSWLDGHGLEPSVSLFSSPFDETVDIADEVERAKRFAATQLELGLDRTMVSSMEVRARKDRPAVGADFQPGRLALAIDSCGVVCQVLQREGLRPLHHSHVGGVFETEDEIDALLEGLGPDLLGVGADTGHLRWAGVDPVAFVTRHADRVGALHVKDCFADFLDGAPAAEGRSYADLQATKRLWAEPGAGVIDLEAVVAALPGDFDGDLMIEVDEPSVASAVESHRLSFAWAQEHLPAVA